MQTLIETDHLGKAYRLGQFGRTSLREGINDLLSRFRPGGAPGINPAAKKGSIWALKDVSFRVDEGEVVGIIGQNGAGKSTLLKLLSRITDPSAGRAAVMGRVSSLLEVGTGFHPELTGRENIYLNAAILGMPHSDVKACFDEIVEFAGVGAFLDTPVKRYSSGMYVRLAFAVGAHLRPDILIVDEVLAVGDVRFQKKCAERMDDVSKREGRTILFVSHNMETISGLTDRCLVLAGGRLTFDGPTPEAVRFYLRGDGDQNIAYEARNDGRGPRLTTVEVGTSEPGMRHEQGAPLNVKLNLTTPAPLKEAFVSFRILNSAGIPAARFCYSDAEGPLARRVGETRLSCRIPKLRLYPGRYTLSVFLGEFLGQKEIERLEGICSFEVVRSAADYSYKWDPGACVYIEDSVWTTG